MLFAVEGGGFFSSSATGYSKGLTLLLLGHKNKEKPMRVSPWNHYQLVEQETDSDLQLASCKNRISRGCATCISFGRASAGLEGPAPPKVDFHRQQDVLPESPPIPDKDEDCVSISHGEDGNGAEVYLKSSLKKPSEFVPVVGVDDSVQGALDKNENEVLGVVGRRKVQWTDACGGELVKIKEFELSDSGGSDDDFGRNEQTCACAVM
ncbi:hypothetical protein GIB67_020474 [Kingdonia uniflora]|uniref:Uncharacterized protein n=1 Tax=Kingdonia uniflora TaxID=39325 RepID=A0A7J7LV22_9MAGN|nr:hypothetical protein GIB67_020474 [Kingdonia uniflora]